MSRSLRSAVVGVFVVGSLAVSGMAEEATERARAWFGPSEVTCTWGGDIRLRAIHLDEIPVHVEVPKLSEDGVLRGETEFYRYRSRLWSCLASAEDVSLRGRLVYEGRHQEQSRVANSWGWPDEVIVDQLYLDLNNLLDGRLDLRIGRQDLIYGTGKLILDGTPLDGSRTIYLDAAKATWKGMQGATIDIVGIYQSAENDLVVGNEHRNLTGVHPADEQYDEYGGLIYLKGALSDSLKCELYNIYKVEEDYVTRNGVTNEEANIMTFGGRLMPSFGGGLNGNVEAAYQTGTRGDVALDAYMLDAALNWSVPVLEEMKPVLTLGYYYLSGDDPNTAENERWDPLWARWPQYSELYIYAFDTEGAGWWSNVSMPHVGLSLVPWKGGRMKLMVAELSAPEKNGPGTGDKRGLLTTFRTDFTLASNVLREDDSIVGHVLFEYLDPDDYYNEADEAAHFARLEISYLF